MSVTGKTLRCLIVEDVDDDVQLLLLQLRAGGYDVTWERVDTPEAMRAALARQPWDFVLSDYRMPRFSGLEAFELLRASGLDLPFIIVSGIIGEETAVAAMKAGVDDYLIKGELGHLTVAVERELRNAATRRDRGVAEAARRQSEADLLRAQEIADMGNWSLDLQKNHVTWSAEMYRIYGTTPETFDHTPQGVAKFIHPEDAARQFETIEMLIQGRTFEPFEYRVVRPDGEIRVVHVFACEMERDAAGRPVRVFGAVQDITERNQAEEQLRQQAEELRTKNDALERFNAVAVGRELSMVKLKREMNELCAKLGQPPRYRIATTEPADAEGAGGASPSLQMRQIDPTNVRILVVDDDPEILNGTARLLEKEGYAIDRAASGEAALKTARDCRPDLIVLDRSLPGIDGLEVSRRIKRDPALADILVVIASGKKVESADQAEGLEAGADGYIVRPIANRELLARIEAYVRIVGLTRALRLKAEALQRNSAAALNLTEEAVEAQKGLEAKNQELLINTAALSAAANAIVITDIAGDLMWANLAFSTLTGYALAEVVGKNPRELVKSGQHAAPFYHQMWKTVLGGRVWRGELVNRRKDGSFYPEEMTITPVRAAGGEITHFIAIKQDLTEHKQAEAKVREREARYAAMVKSISDAIISADQAGNVVGWNLGAERIFGYPESEILGQPLIRLLPAKHHAGHLAGMTRVTTDGPRHIIGTTEEVEGRRKDGSEFPLHLSLSEWQIGKQGFFTAVIHDITARKQAEVALHESEQRYRLLFENNPLPMWLYDIETFRFLAVNESAVQRYGYTREEFLGMTLQQICNPEDVPMLLERIKREQTGANSTGELRHLRKDGTTIHVETFSRLLTFAGRSVRLALVNDITEKKLMEGKFLHAQRLESIGMLAAGIAHDLNNVLAPIMFSAPLLRMSLTTPRDAKILATLEKSAGRGAGLVKQILGFVHSSTGERRPTQVKHLTRDIIELIEETFPKSIQLEPHIPADLWQVQGDATQIHQVLLNLCVNARDAMPSGGTLGITAANRRLAAAECEKISGSRPGDWLMLEVTDTGSGIAPAALARIWEPFFTTKGKGKGTGLGLSTVRGIVISHQGFVELLTEVGHGTTFRVYLPALESKAGRPDAVTPGAIPDGHGELLLVVDDESTIRDLASDSLIEHGYRVLTCADGVEALELFTTRASDFSLILTDFDMPRFGGVALARAALLIRPDIRLIGMSGLSRNQTGGVDLPEIRKLAHGFLPKPFKPDELLSTIHGVLHPSTET